MNEGIVSKQTNNAPLKHSRVRQLDSEKGGNVTVKPYWKRYTSGNYLIIYIYKTTRLFLSPLKTSKFEFLRLD